MNIKEIRRYNLRLLAKEVGGISKLAEFLDKQPSFISQIIGSNVRKNIGDKLASEIEAKFNKEEGWLDGHYEANVYIKTAAKIRGSYSLKTDIPLIEWAQIGQFINNGKKQIVSFVLPRRSSLGDFSKYAFALQIKDPILEGIGGVTFPRGSIIIVEPEQSIKDSSFVIVQIDKSQSPLLLQYISETSRRRYLKPFNAQTPLIEYQNHHIIYGIVCLSIYKIRYE